MEDDLQAASLQAHNLAIFKPSEEWQQENIVNDISRHRADKTKEMYDRIFVRMKHIFRVHLQNIGNKNEPTPSLRKPSRAYPSSLK